MMTPRRAAAEPNASVGEDIPRVATVVRRTREFEGLVTLDMALEAGPPSPRPAPGQFNMLYAFGVGEAAISFSDIPDDELRLVHTVRQVGAISGALTRLKKGEQLGVRGPFGVGWPVSEATGRDVIVVAGGIGLAPLRPLIRRLAAKRNAYGSVTLLVGARTPDALAFRPDLSRWALKHNVDVRITVDAADATWTENVGLVTTLIDALSVNGPRTVAYVCGPEIMMRHVAEALTARGVAEEAVWLSLERNMKCAIGLCGHCQFGPDFVCKDGPVFRYDRIRDKLFVKEL